MQFIENFRGKLPAVILPLAASLLSLLLIITGCGTTAQPDIEAVRQAIETQNARFAEAYNRGDAAGVAQIYTENARSLPPNKEMKQGREAVQESTEADFAMGVTDLSLTAVSVEVHGNTAYEIGKYTVNVAPAGQPVIRDSGKYVAIWKKQPDASWLIDVDIWNSSMPLPELQ